MGAGFLLLLAGMGFARYAYPMLLPSMQESLGVTYGPMGVLGTVNLIGYMAFSIIAGILATSYGPKIVVTGAMILAGMSMVLLGMATEYWMAFVLLFLAGAATAGTFTPIAGLGRAWTPPNLGGFTQGFLSSGAASGIVIAAFIVPIFLTSSGAEGWRPAWITMGAVAFALTILAVFALKEKPAQNGADGRPVAAAPVVWGQVFRNRTIAGICLAYFLYGFYQIYATFFVAYLRRALNLPADVVGNIWFYWAMLAFLLMAGWGFLSDRIGRKPAVTICAIPLVASVLMPIFWQDITVLYISAMLYGATYGGPMQIILATAGEAVPRHLAAAALGLVTAFFGLGQAVSPAIAGFMTDLTGSFYPGFVLCAVVLALSALIFNLWPLQKAV